MVATNDAGEKYRYEQHSWPEINDAVDAGKLVLIPTACVEDHGHHLPIDVDIEIVSAICDRTAASREDTLLFPTVDNGYDPHHMHFPGTVTLQWDTFVDYLIDIGVSLGHHGFERILFLNGHGSNHHLVEQASRQIILQYPGLQAAMLSWWQLEEVHETIQAIGDGGPEGSGHAGEMETSLYMHLHPDAVDEDAAVKDIGYPESKHFNQTGPSFTGTQRDGASTPVTMREWWSTISETGVMGDATVASAEKGAALLDAAVEGLDSVLDDLAAYPRREPPDHHDEAKTPRDFDPFRPR